MCQDFQDPKNLSRGLYYKYPLDDNDYDSSGKPEFICSTHDPATLVAASLVDKLPNLIGSKLTTENILKKEFHAPVIDMDFPCGLVPSSTPGHFHLFIDQPITHEKYAKLIHCMGEIGLLQPGFVKMFDLYGQTLVRWNTTKQSEGLL